MPGAERTNALRDTCGADPGATEDLDHGSRAGMSGMMSEADISTLKGTEAARLHLEHMIVHDEGQVEMAHRQVAQGQNLEGVELARHVVEDQEAEIAEIERMLQELPEGS
ncbi:DUF305 domain-containing protein [Nesterenkonia sp. DZ6]|uniref:DUF305 domain-containing protein n=1 Tax=Nesterenkonia sp. DZ6 TaxID=2901229 RepID=UPI001F4C6280|nr:DUF305 domain-containing protein [Nesterenkonia sp. DZ6]MCH8560353.1 DUF305 domain-containing protein [Nesterenkonia sp. DZ6]